MITGPAHRAQALSTDEDAAPLRDPHVADANPSKKAALPYRSTCFAIRFAAYRATTSVPSPRRTNRTGNT